MSSSLSPPPAALATVDSLAFSLVRQILEARATITRCELLCRELLMAAAAGSSSADARREANAAIAALVPPPSPPPAAPPRPASPRSRAAVDNTDAAKKKRDRLVTKRTTPLNATRPVATPRLMQLDLEAGNDELLAASRAERWMH